MDRFEEMKNACDLYRKLHDAALDLLDAKDEEGEDVPIFDMVNGVYMFDTSGGERIARIELVTVLPGGGYEHESLDYPYEKLMEFYVE